MTNDQKKACRFMLTGISLAFYVWLTIAGTIWFDDIVNAYAASLWLTVFVGAAIGLSAMQTGDHD